MLTSVEAHGQVALEEIVVTAERRSEDIQRSALSITAISGDSVLEKSINRPEDLTKIAPSLNIAQGGGGQTQIYVRGVGNLGGNVLAESAISFNVDGVYVGRQTGMDGLFYDLERIEVLKGPQGTLYGRNATGGAINVITAKPKLGEFGGTAMLELGNFAHVKASGAANLPIGETLAVRAAFLSVQHDGYLSDGYGDQDLTALRGHLFWQPNEAVSLLVSGDFVKVGGQGGGPTPSFRTCGDWCGPTDPRNRALARSGRFATTITAPGDDGVGFNDNRFWSLNAELNWDFGPATLTVLPAHREAEIDQLALIYGYSSRVLDSSKQDSVEVRLGSNGDGRLKWVAGLYWYDEDIDGDFEFSHGRQLQVNRLTPKINNRDTSAFGQATFSLTDTLRLTGGLRFTKEEKTMGGAVVCPVGSLCGPTAPVTNPLRGDASWDDTSYKIGVEWDAAPQSLIYATVSTGFKAGGFFPAARDNTFRPEKLTAFALGTKNRFLDERLQINAEAFYWDYKDHQESHIGPACVNTTPAGACLAGQAFITENVGKSEIKGVDLDVQVLLTENDRLYASVAYLDAIATEFAYVLPVNSPPSPLIACRLGAFNGSFPVDCSGQQQPRAPEWSGVVGYEHTFRLGEARLVASVSTRFSASYWGSIDYLPGTRQESFNMSDASLTYREPEDRWSVTAYVNNIEDVAVASISGVKVFTTVPYEGLFPPRTYGLRFNAKFGNP